LSFLLSDKEKLSTASGLTYDWQLLKKSSTPTILARMLRNLLSIYEQDSDEQMARPVRAFLELLENEEPIPE